MSDEQAPPGPDRDEEALNRWQKKRNTPGGNGEDKHPYRVWVDDAALSLDADYLIKGLIERAACHVIYGPSGDGKTFFTIDMAYSIATGSPWRGRRVKLGLVVYVAAEAGAGVLRRFIAWRSRHVGDLAPRTPLVILTRGTNLLNVEAVGALIEELRDISKEAGIPIALAVFDTLSRSMPGGDENKTDDMSRVIAASDEIRATFGAGTLIVHHSGKDRNKGMRGNSSLRAAADVVIRVEAKVATVEKVRDGIDSDVFPFRLEVIEIGLDSDGEMRTTCLVAHNLENSPFVRSKPVKLSNCAQVGFDALKTAIEEHGEILPATSVLPAGARAVQVDHWMSVYYRIRPISQKLSKEESRKQANTRRMAFNRAQNDLQATRIASTEAGFWWIN
jgi:KaiC/GvpD/RAD55 family RecA-like ATPase